MTEARTYKRILVAVMMGACTIPASRALAQQDGAGDEPVTREEFMRFLEEYKQLKADVAKLQEENSQLRQQAIGAQRGDTMPPQVDWETQLDTRFSAERDATMDRMRDEFGPTLDALSPGMTNFTLGGSAVVTYQDRENADSTFGATIAPILLWKPTDRLLLETQVAFILDEEETEVELGQFQMSYLLNDYLTIGAGKFLTPFGTFWERWHPTWINKTPTMPLMYERGLIGESGLGAQVRGGFPIGDTKLNYAAYYVNGPNIDEASFAIAGNLGFENFRDNNNNKAFGGRVGFLPIPEMELGYSFQTGRVGGSGSLNQDADTLIQGVDFSYAREFESIKGRLDLRAEAIWVNTDDVAFLSPSGTVMLNTDRSGWFAQAAYRPTLSDYTFASGVEARNLEFVVRYDQLQEPGSSPRGSDVDRLTLGIDYWIRPNVVVKTAYMRDNVQGDDDLDAFFVQWAIGF